MDYSMISDIESRFGVQVEYEAGYSGGFDTCTIKVPWGVVKLGILANPEPSGRKLAEIESVMATHGFILSSSHEHGLGNLFAGRKTIMVFIRRHH